MEYYARSPLEVFAVDENMERLTGSIPYTSLVWHRRYNKPGEFRMDVLSDVYDPSWAFIVCSDRPETGIVQKVGYSDTALTPDGKDTITVSGFFLETLLYDVTFLVEETGEEVIEIEAPRNSNRGYTSNQEPVEVYWSTVANEYVYRDKTDGQIKDNDGNTVAFGGLERVDYEWNGKVHEDSIERPDGSKADGYWQDRNGYYTSDDGETISRVSYASSSGGPGSDKTFDVELKVGGKYFYKWNDSTLVMVNGVSESRDNTYWLRYKKWENGPKTKTIQVKGPWQRTDIGEPEEEGDSVQLVIKWVRKFFTNEWQFTEPEFEGETMVLDLSLKYLGDVVYDTLARIEAAPRVQYDYESDTTVFSVYRGKDLTQDAMQSTADEAQKVVPAMAMLSPAVGASVVPSGYTQIEYIDSTGTQWIDTGFTPNQNTRVLMDATVLDQSDQTDAGFYAFSSCTPDFTSGGIEMYTWLGKATSVYGPYTPGNLGSTIEVGDRIIIDHNAGHITITRGTGTVVDYEHGAASFTSPRTLALMALRRSSQPYNSVMRLHGCAVYDNGAQVRDFIPARKNSDGSVGLYDLLNGQFYGNAGSGAFVAGPDVDLSDQLIYSANAQTYTGSTGPTDGLTGQQVEVLPNGFSVQGHVFVSWNTIPDGTGTTYMPGEMYTLTGGNDVLYAIWSESEDPEDPDEPVEPDEAFPYAVFNDTWGSMYGYSASADDSNYKNTCFVLYDYDKPAAFTTNGYPKPEGITGQDSEGYLTTTGWRIPYTAEQGYFEVTVGDEGERRQETYLDMREQDPSCDGDWPRDDQQLDESKPGDWFEVASESEIEAFLQEQGIPKCRDIYDGFPQSLKDAGTTYLKTNYGRVYNLDTGTLNTDGYIRDYDLGDKVDWGVYSLGIQRIGRITEVEEVYESGNIRINLTIGDELVSLMDKARRN